MKKTILLTGGSSGIGKTIAKILSQHYDLILCSQESIRLKNILKKLSNPSNHKVFQCDLSDVISVEKMMKVLVYENRINNFIHCAGVSYVSYAKNFNYTEMIKCANINLYSAMLITKFLLKKDLKSSLENIIFISSILSKKGEKGNSLYASTKAALDSYMKSLSLELAPDIRVNSILPGGIFQTKMTQGLFSDEQKKEILKKYPLGEGKTQDIAHVVKFLLKSRWITGQQIIVDGGYSV